MKQIRFIEETNGQISGSVNGVRYKGRDTYEDRVRYAPADQEPRVYTLIHNYDKSIRRRGKWDKNRVIAEYPNARGFDHIVKSTGEVYRSTKIKHKNYKKS